MSISDAVAPHIPFLRRFSRALTGTQAGGDAYVVATLETILAEPGSLDAAELFRKSRSTSYSCKAGATCPRTMTSISRSATTRPRPREISRPSPSNRGSLSC